MAGNLFLRAHESKAESRHRLLTRRIGSKQPGNANALWGLYISQCTENYKNITFAKNKKCPKYFPSFPMGFRYRGKHDMNSGSNESTSHRMLILQFTRLSIYAIP